MKNTNAAPMEMYPTKKRKKVTSCRPSSTPSFNHAAVDGFVVSALTVVAMARATVAISSRLVVFENF